MTRILTFFARPPEELETHEFLNLIAAGFSVDLNVKNVLEMPAEIVDKISAEYHYDLFSQDHFTIGNHDRLFDDIMHRYEKDESSLRSWIRSGVVTHSDSVAARFQKTRDAAEESGGKMI
jgi:hypothetical protein